MTTSKQVVVPDIGDATDVGVVEVLVKPGMRIAKEQSIVVLESEKASMEIPAPFAGVVREVKVEAGASVSKGSLLLLVEPDDATTNASTTSAAETTAPASPPPAAPSSTSAPLPPPPPLMIEAPAPRDEGLRNPATSLRPIAPRISSLPPAPASPKLPHATPSVRRLGRELGVDLSQVPGTGRSGRITKDDVQSFVKHALSVVGKSGGPGLQVAPAPEIDFTKFGEISLQPLTKIQKVSARNLHRSWVTIPHVTQFDEADITELEEFRKKSIAGTKGKEGAPKLTLLSFFMKAVVVVLKAMPKFNASLDASGENLILKHYFHIGIAVDTPNGLMVPVIRDVDVKGLHDLAKELADVSERARARRLSPDDMQGASMTISSLGGIGGTAFTPIINPPEVAILGVSRSEMKPVYQDGEFVPRLMCPLSLSYDHRVIDGADAARFTTKLRSVLSDIREMLL